MKRFVLISLESLNSFRMFFDCTKLIELINTLFKQADSI